LQFGNMHFLPSAEVFSGFTIVTPIGRTTNKKAAKVSCLPLRPKDFPIFCIVLFIPHYWALSNNLLLRACSLTSPHRGREIRAQTKRRAYWRFFVITEILDFSMLWLLNGFLERMFFYFI